MGFRIWAYYFRYALDNIFTNRLIHAVSIGTIGVSLLLFSAFILLFINLNNWMGKWGQSLSMSVYLKDDIDPRAQDRIESLLKNLPGAEFEGYISKQEAMMDLVEGLGEHSGLLSGLKENPLPASFEIVFRDVNIRQINPGKMKEEIEKLEGVEEVQYSEEVLERFAGLMYLLKVAGFVIGGSLCLAVLFITTNTIKLTIYSRGEEIEIFKLVGATDRFIKIPFLIEGAFQGLIGGLLALSALFLLYSLFSLKELHVLGLPVLSIVFMPVSYMGLILALSVALGLIGSLIAVGRFFEI